MHATREAYAEWPQTTLWMAAGGTLNPRVLGSNPSRPSNSPQADDYSARIR